MKNSNLAIWMETRAGRRTLIASFASRTLAILVGEALWAHFCQIRVTPLDVYCIEVLDGCSSCEPDSSTSTPRIIARWSASGREQSRDSRPSLERDEAEQQVTAQVALERQAHLTENPGLAAFFPTAEKWTPWKAWRALDL